MLPHSLHRSRYGYSQPVTLACVIWGLLEVDITPRREPTLSEWDLLTCCVRLSNDERTFVQFARKMNASMRSFCVHFFGGGEAKETTNPVRRVRTPPHSSRSTSKKHREALQQSTSSAAFTSLQQCAQVLHTFPASFLETSSRQDILQREFFIPAPPKKQSCQGRKR